MVYNDYLQFIVVIAGFGTLILSLENIRCIDVVSKNGILSWDILRHQHPTKKTPFFDNLFTQRGLMVVYISQALLAIASLILAILHVYSFFIFIFLLILYAIPVLRSSYGNDGALQMYIVLYFSLVLITVSPSNTFIPELGMIFIGVQGVLSYSISGITKLVSPEWRNGGAMRGIFSTKIYGNKTMFRYLNGYPYFCLIASWFVISFEVLFIFSVLISPTTTLVFLSIGFLFHLFNMIFMGLNNFFFAFLAAYPSIYYISIYYGPIILSF